MHKVCQSIRSGKIKYVHVGLPCSSFSCLMRLWNKGTRTRSRPEGSGTMTKEILGNRLLRHSVKIIRCRVRNHVFWTLENPRSSLAFLMPQLQALMRLPNVSSVVFDQCSFGLRDPASHKLYKKATRVIGHLPGLDKLCRPCTHNHDHEIVKGKVCVDGAWVSRSSLAGHYPPELCSAWASIVSEAVRSNSCSARRRRQGVPFTESVF